MNDTKTFLDKNQALVNICASYFDSFIKENADFRSKSGIKETITRTMVSETCAWCEKLVGTYEYGNEPEDIFRRHDNCDCLVTHTSSRGVQDAHTKKWIADDSLKGFNLDPTEATVNTNALTRKYLTERFPSQGVLGMENGFNALENKAELNVASWVYKYLGGDITMLNGDVNALWKGIKWAFKQTDLKDLTSLFNKIDGAYGIVLRYFDNDDLNEVIEIVSKAVKESGAKDLDVILVKGDKMQTALRF